MPNLRLTFRRLAKSPGFTAIAVLTLALGIGANTSMFSVLNALLFHTPPYHNPASLIRVYRTSPSFQSGPHSPANFLDLRAHTRSFTHLAAFAGNNYNLVEPGQLAERLRGMDVSGDFFAVLGVQPALGRFITVEDDEPGKNQVIVLSDATWRQRFGANPMILGQPIHLSGEVVTVIGVMPPGFDDPFLWGTVAAWRPLAFSPETKTSRGGNWLHVVGRLRPEITSEQALAETNAIAANLANEYPETNAKTGYRLVPLARSVQDETSRLLSLFAMGLAGCVLLIACANLANLLFARNVLLMREHAIRAALGASRLQLIGQSLTESLVLALAGGALGVLVAAWCNDASGARLKIGSMAGIALPIDWSVIGFAFSVTLLTGVGFGLLPALSSSRTDVNEKMKQGARGATSGSHQRVRHTLIVAEVALALVLLSGAGFFLRGLQQFVERDHGWRTENLLTANLTLPWANYRDDPSQIAFYERLQSGLAQLPGVERAALSRTLPFSNFGWSQRFLVEGQPPPAPGSEPMRDVNGVSPEFFETVGLELVAGRAFTAADIDGPIRTIVSETMANQLWPGENPLGKRIMHPIEKKWHEVIGVVRHVTFAANLEKVGLPFQTYRLLAREPGRGVVISLRSPVAPSTLAAAVRRVVAEIDPELSVQDIQPAVQVIESRLSNYVLTGRLLTGFALLGLLLAAIGIYGVISGFVAHQTNEIGIRLALGAQLRDVLRLVLGRGLRLTFIGVAFGLAGAWAVSRVLASMIPVFTSPEAATVASVTLVLVSCAFLACWLPARRATKVDPMVALRLD